MRPLAWMVAAMTAAHVSPVAAGKISLEDAMRMAGDRPAAQAGDDQAKSARAVATAERRQALLPSLSVTASGERRSRDLTLSMGMTTLDISDKQRLSGQVGVRQPLLDASRLFYAAPAAKLEAKAAELSAGRNRELLAADAATRYFDVLEIDARRAAASANVASLEARLAELETLVTEGRAIDRDRRRLRLALDDAKLAVDNLGRQRKVAALAFGLSIGQENEAEPAPLPPRRSEALPVAGPRLDVRAIESQRDAVLKRRAGVHAELIPTISLEGAWVYDDALFADQDNFFVVSLNLTWTPLAAGTRSSRRRALEAQASALARQRIETERAANLELESAKTAVESAEAALEVATRGVEDAREAQRVTSERYRAGRETVSDLLEVEALLRDRETVRAVAEIAVRRAEIAQRLAAGGLGK